MLGVPPPANKGKSTLSRGASLAMELRTIQKERKTVLNIVNYV